MNMTETENNFTTTIRISIETYHELEDLKKNKKIRNLQETGKVGDANFDDIIKDLLLNNNGNGGEFSTNEPVP